MLQFKAVFVCAYFFISVAAFSQHKVHKVIAGTTIVSKADSLFEEKIIDTVNQFKKIIMLNHRIDSITAHQHGVAIITEKPHDNIKYWYLRVGYDGPDRFISFYTFSVYKKGFVIKFNDPVSAKQVSIDKWNKMK